MHRRRPRRARTDSRFVLPIARRIIMMLPSAPKHAQTCSLNAYLRAVGKARSPQNVAALTNDSIRYALCPASRTQFVVPTPCLGIGLVEINGTHCPLLRL